MLIKLQPTMLGIVFNLLFVISETVLAVNTTSPFPRPEWRNLTCLSEENECQHYTLSTIRMSYGDARDACAVEKFHLVFLETAAEQELVRKKLTTAPKAGPTEPPSPVDYWLGLVNHTVWTWPGRGRWLANYTNWTGSEPIRNDSTKTVSYVAFEGNWVSTGVTGQHFALCEGEPDTGTTWSAVHSATTPLPALCADGSCWTTIPVRPLTSIVNKKSSSAIECAARCSRETTPIRFNFHKVNKSCECQIHDTGVHFMDMADTGSVKIKCYTWKREMVRPGFLVYTDAKTSNCP